MTSVPDTDDKPEGPTSQTAVLMNVSATGYKMYGVFRHRPEENFGREYLHYALNREGDVLNEGERVEVGYFIPASCLAVPAKPKPAPVIRHAPAYVVNWLFKSYSIPDKKRVASYVWPLSALEKQFQHKAIVTLPLIVHHCESAWEELVDLEKESGYGRHTELLDRYYVNTWPAGNQLSPVLLTLHKTAAGSYRALVNGQVHPLLVGFQQPLDAIVKAMSVFPEGQLNVDMDKPDAPDAKTVAVWLATVSASPTPCVFRYCGDTLSIHSVKPQPQGLDFNDTSAG